MSVVQPGRDPRSPYSRRVSTRLLDFTRAETPWARRLWDVGTFLALEELYEAGVWMDRRVLHPSAVEWQRKAMERVLGDDPGFGGKMYRKEMQDLLRNPLTLVCDSRRKLRQHIDFGRPGYLGRWEACIADEEPPRPERVARAVAAHLLDSGHSLPGLHRWLRAGRQNLAAVDLITEATALLAVPPRIWEVVVPFQALGRHEELANHLPNWLPADAALAVITQAGGRTPLQLVGALVFHVEARDSGRAVELAYDQVERLQARARFAGTGAVSPLGEAYVAGERGGLPLIAPARGAHVLSLAAERELYVVGLPVQNGVAPYLVEPVRSTVDEALEIASALNHGPLAPAIAGGWAALESLLNEGRDPEERKVMAATRAAALVACSWPRAEFTALSYRIRDDPGDDLPQRLAACGSNRERASLVAAELEKRDALPIVRSWRTANDLAAVFRMRDLLADRKAVLNRVRWYMEVSFRRLYRCRNIVLHGGSTGGVALDATLRVTAPLVGAALDRLTHAHLVTGVAPLALAARAETALRMIGDEVGRDLCDLIE